MRQTRLALRTVAASLALLAPGAHAEDRPGEKLRIAGVPLGSGVPRPAQAPQSSVADAVADNHYHVPNYLPGYPTAAVLWPREVQVPCRRDDASGDLNCAGYEVSPLRGEYIYVRPVVLEAAPRPAPPSHKKPLG